MRERFSGKQPLKGNMMKTVVFTDLDGTVLDEKYSFQDVKPIITQLLFLDAAVVLCSSKTRTEIEFYRRALSISDPFISENGGAIFVPKNYFKVAGFDRQTREYDIIELGIPYVELRKKLQSIRDGMGCKLVGFGDMSTEEVAKDSGLSVELAGWAKQREYGEPFRIVDCNEEQLFKTAKAEGLHVTKGDRYYHLKGKNDKGNAVMRLKEVYVKNFGQIRTIGVGNSANDLPMLDVVDAPFFREKTEPVDVPWKKILAKVVNQSF